MLDFVEVVRHDHDGAALLAVNRLQKVDDLLAGVRVEITGGLIREEERGIGDEGASDSHALLLSARQLRGAMVQAIAKPDHAESLRRSPTTARGCFARENERKRHVFPGGHRGHEVKLLKDDADHCAPKFSLLRPIQRAQIPVAYADVSTRRAVHRRQQVQKGRFARPARSDHRDELPIGHIERDIGQCRDGL